MQKEWMSLGNDDGYDNFIQACEIEGAIEEIKQLKKKGASQWNTAYNTAIDDVLKRLKIDE